MLDVYSSQPKYDPARTDISKENFEAYYMSTAYDAKDLPFNEKEIAMIGMAATLSAPKAEEAFFRQKPSTNRDHQFFIESRTLWMQDCFMHNDSTRENALTDYHEIIHEGNWKAAVQFTSSIKNEKQQKAEIWKARIRSAQEDLEKLSDAEINDPNNEKLKKPLAVIITAYTAKHASPDQERTFRSNQNFDRAVQEMMESEHLKNLLRTSSRPELVKDAQKGEGRRLIEALSNAKNAEMEANQAKQSKNMKKSEPEKKNPDRKI